MTHPASGLSTAQTAIDLGRGLQAHLAGWAFPPEYARSFRSNLEALSASGNVCAGAAITGRFAWAKRILARFFRPFQANQSRFNQLVAMQFADLFDLVSGLHASRADLREMAQAEVKHFVQRLRAELFLEVQGMGKPVASSANDATRAQAILLAMNDAPQVHLGALRGAREGYLNIDAVAGTAVDLVCPLDQLPVAAGTLAELVGTHVIERFPAAMVTGRLLPYWVSLLRPGGRLILVTTDVQAAVDSWYDGRLDDHDFVSCLFEGESRCGTARQAAFTPDLLRHHVQAAGLAHASVTRRWQDADGSCFAFSLEASKPVRGTRGEGHDSAQ